jgi:signal transduction histidine kinase
MRKRWQDWAFMLVATAVQVSSAQPGMAQPSAVAGSMGLLAALASGFMLLWRGQAPFSVLAVATGGYVVQAAAVGPVLPAVVAVACYSAARFESGLRGPLADVLAVAAVAVTVVARGDAALAPVYAVPLLLAVLAGLLVAARLARLEAMRRAAVVAERLRIARDLHDVVGHGMSAITVQAGAARMALAAGAEAQARDALINIEQAGRAVLREVRWLVGVLREQSEDTAVGDLPGLVAAARGAGYQVQFTVDGDLAAMRPSVASVAYRIAQEALTNAFRHSGCTEVLVHVDVGSVAVLSVLDDGHGGAAAEGNGIRGMRERVAAVGGELIIGPRPDGPGWQVRATLPVSSAAR